MTAEKSAAAYTLPLPAGEGRGEGILASCLPSVGMVELNGIEPSRSMRGGAGGRPHAMGRLYGQVAKAFVSWIGSKGVPCGLV